MEISFDSMNRKREASFRRSQATSDCIVCSCTSVTRFNDLHACACFRLGANDQGSEMDTETFDFVDIEECTWQDLIHGLEHEEAKAYEV